jgi:hypothetical protein
MQRPSASTLRHPFCSFHFPVPVSSPLNLCVFAALREVFFLCFHALRVFWTDDGSLGAVKNLRVHSRAFAVKIVTDGSPKKE